MILLIQALVNHENVTCLRNRAVAFMELLSEYHATLGARGIYKKVVGQYRELLEVR